MPKKNKSFFGKAFGDEFKRVSTKYTHFNKDRGGSGWEESLITGVSSRLSTNHLMSDWRKLALVFILIVITLGFFTRLFHLQIVEGKENRERADFNRIQVRTVHAPRGVIYDRNGKVLAQNEPGFRLSEKGAAGSATAYISRDEALKMEVDGDPRFELLEIDNIRAYPMGEVTAHVLGYVSEITGEELKDGKFKGYQGGDKIGRGGVEEAYEKILKGVDGGEVIEIDANGKRIRTLRQKEAVPGQNLHLSIDAELQKKSFEVLSGAVKKTKSCCAALVAQNPQTGEILSMVSLPSYDPSKVNEALVAGNSPILNRAIAGLYPPGSTFKIASSLAGLSSGKITPQTQFEDTGVMSLGTFTFANWYFTQYGKKEGVVDLVRALQRSNDIYYYHLGQLTGEKVLGDAAKKLGLGEQLGLDIPGEVSGLIPDNEWKVKNIGDVWYPGDSLHMSIGQGFVLTTPLQILNMTSIIAASGKEYPPHIALKITSPSGRTIKEYKYEGSMVKGFRGEDIKVIQKGLALVPKDGGTAWPFFTFPVPTAGKTGTAEFGDPKNRTHAWYTAYGSIDHPQIAVTTIVEAGGEGSSTTAPVVKEVMRYFFSSDKNNLIKDTNQAASDSARTLGE